MSVDLVIDKSKTALVVIDLQKGITALPSRPYTAQEVIANAALLVDAFRRNDMPVFLVHVQMTNETMLNVISDQTFSRPQPASQDWGRVRSGAYACYIGCCDYKEAMGSFLWHGAGSAAQKTENRYNSAMRNIDRFRGGEHSEICL